MKYLLPIFFIVTVFLSSCATSESTKKELTYHYDMGMSYLGENNLTSALIELTEAEKLAPDDPNILHSLGCAYYRKKKYEIAEQKFLKAISLKPDFSQARNNLGLDYMEMKRWDDALRQFKIASNDIFYAGQDSATINLGRAYCEKGEYERALSIMRSEVSANPRNSAARFYLGRTYADMNKLDLAIDEYKKSIMLFKDNSEANYYLALAYLKLKNTDAAAAAFKEVVRITPDSEHGLLSREYLETLKR
jgi:type IV pilus assembly protein PilF